MLAATLLLLPAAHGLLDVRLTENAPSMLLLDRDHEFIATIENDDRQFGFWDMPSVLPENLVAASIAAEDRRFRSHPGVDPLAVAAAFRSNYIRHGVYRGASTLAMQVARLQRGGSSGWYFKIHDAVVALGITILHGREEILRQYFRIAPYGNRISGAACASRRYFHKPIQDLSMAEAALLASLPKAPSRFNLFREDGWILAKQRAELILRRAAAYRLIPAASLPGALSELSSLVRPVAERRRESSFHFLMQCARRLEETPHREGVIRTTLDQRLQDTLFAILRGEIPRLQQKDVDNAAAMVVDIPSGEVLAYLGSVDYRNDRGGAIDCANLPRSTGSLLKPFIYGMGMEWLGYTPATILTDLDFDFGSGNRSFIPENSDRKYQGPVLYKNALANSRNIPAVQVLQSIGVDLFYRRCIALGLTEDDGKEEYYGLGLSIGGLYCTLQQIAGAYLALANDGYRKKLQWEIPDSTRFAGNASLAGAVPSGPEASPVIPPEIARQIKRFLADPLARLPTFPRGGNLEYPFAVATKTGTSEGFRDSWCVAFSDKYLVVVWLGNTNFSPTRFMSGYRGAAPIARNIMFALHPDRIDGQSDVEFPPPRGFVPVPICRLTGKRADRLTPFVTTEYFRPGTEPLEISTASQLIPVDKRNGLLAPPPCQAPIEYRRFTVLDPQYSDWARSQGLEVPPDRISPHCGETATINSYQVEIVSPRNGSRFFIDPEMPAGASIVPLHAKASPSPSHLLWMVNGEESELLPYHTTFQLPMKPGTYEIQAVVPRTEFRSKPITLEIF